MTLKSGIEGLLKREMPEEIVEVIATMTKSIIISLFLVPFILAGQNKTEKLPFCLQFKPIIAAAYFDAGNKSAQWENYNFKLSPRFGQSLGMILKYHFSSTFSTETGLNLVIEGIN